MEQLVTSDVPNDQVPRLPGARPPAQGHTASGSAEALSRRLDHQYEICLAHGHMVRQETGPNLCVSGLGLDWCTELGTKEAAAFLFPTAGWCGCGECITYVALSAVPCLLSPGPVETMHGGFLSLSSLSSCGNT